MSDVKPFIKWVGGKTQIINDLINNFPKNINNYHEIFLGGGSVLLSILKLQKKKSIIIKKNIYAYDVNEVLIHTYINIQNNYQELHLTLKKYFNEYDSLKGNTIIRNPKNLEEGLTSKESYYYFCRNKFNKFENKSDIDCSALFIFLNKTCFRGLYREGPNGFNVPYGHYKKTPSFITINELKNFNDLIKNVKFQCLDYKESLKNIENNDFIYLDPPYAPENKKSFVNYTKNNFNLDEHKSLFNLIKDLIKNNNIKILMSNSKVNLVIESFNNSAFTIQDLVCKRLINSKNPESKTTEILIKNY